MTNDLQTHEEAPEQKAPGRRKLEELAMHAWRAERLRGLGLSSALAELFADTVDWHDVARLVRGGCDPLLALEIVR